MFIQRGVGSEERLFRLLGIVQIDSAFVSENSFCNLVWRLPLFSTAMLSRIVGGRI